MLHYFGDNGVSPPSASTNSAAAHSACPARRRPLIDHALALVSQLVALISPLLAPVKSGAACLR